MTSANPPLTTEQQLREMNEALLVSSIHQHELTEQAQKAEAALLRQICNSLPQIVWTARPDGYIDYYNERWYEFTGFPRGEFGQSSWQPILHPDDVQRCVDTYFGCIRDGIPYKIEYRFKDRRRGDYRWFMGRAVPIRDDAGEIVRWFGTCTDIDDQKRVEEALRESEERFARFMQNLPGLAWIKNLQGRYVFANDAAEKAFHMPRAELYGKTDSELFPPETAAQFQLNDQRALESAAGVQVVEVLEQDDGVAHHLIVSKFPILEPDGKPTLIGGMAVDITDRARLEQQTREQAEALADLHRRKDEFLAMLSHELRNPLAPITNALHLLRLQKNEDQLQHQARTVIERQVGQLKRLIDDLLEVSRITTGRIPLHLGRVALNGIVENSVETVRPLIGQHRHALKVSLPPQPIWLNVDAARIEQVVVNLLTNAAKYTADGGRISLSVEQAGDEAVLRVRDSGVGIAPELLPHIFDLFTQADRSLDRSEGGLGIGLSLVQRLVEMHRGRVEAYSVLGQGSEFVVRLPVMTTPTTQPPATHKESTEPNGTSLRVLVVDDNEDAAQTIAMLIKASGHAVRTAHDGQTALDAALDYQPDVVLLDIGLPGLDGFEVAKKLRQESGLSSVVLVAMTGYGQEADRQRSWDAGFNHHLVKPADFGQVREILATVSQAAH